MKKKIMIFVLAAMLTLLLAGTALATPDGEPVGGCPDQFHLHPIDHHDHDEHEHQHVGDDVDKNGDGWLCVKHVSPDGSIHVHKDNNVPLD